MTGTGTALSASPPPQPSPPEVVSGRWRWGRLSPAWRWSVFVFLASRVVVAAGVLTRALLVPHLGTVSAVAYRWDGWWYLDIARRWYSSSLRPPVPGFHHRFSDWAFFPAFPALLRGVHLVTRMPLPATGIVVSLVAGLLAVRAMYALGEHYGGRDVGRGAALLVAVWPASMVFGLPYSEGLYVAATAAALLALMRQRWVVAGLCGAVASGTRATGIAVIAAAAVAAVTAAVRERNPRPLVAPVLTAFGLVAFLAYGWAQTGDVLVWRHAENLWAQQFDMGYPMYVGWAHTLLHGGSALPAVLLQWFGMLAVLAFAAAAWVRRRSLSVPLAVYGLVALVLLLGYSAVGTRPRMVLGVIPGFIWLAAWLRPRVTAVVAVCCLPVLFLATYLSVWKVVP